MWGDQYGFCFDNISDYNVTNTLDFKLINNSPDKYLCNWEVVLDHENYVYSIEISKYWYEYDIWIDSYAN